LPGGAVQRAKGEQHNAKHPTCVKRIKASTGGGGVEERWRERYQKTARNNNNGVEKERKGQVLYRWNINSKKTEKKRNRLFKKMASVYRGGLLQTVGDEWCNTKARKETKRKKNAK